MSASTGPVRLRRRGRPLRWTALTTGGVLAAGMFALVAPTGPAAYAAAPGPDVTRAAIAPALTAGRGADVPFVEQEAENAVTDGTIIGPSTQAYTLPGRGVGPVGGEPGARPVRAVHAARGRERHQRQVQHSGRAGRRRHHRATGCAGQRQLPPDDDADVAVLMALRRSIRIDNDPTEGDNIPADYAVECQCVPADTVPEPVFPAPWRPQHFYAEQRLLLGPVLPGRIYGPPHRSARSEAAPTTSI